MMPVSLGSWELGVGSWALGVPWRLEIGRWRFRASRALLVMLGERALDAPIGHQPDQRDADVDGDRGPRLDVSQRNRSQVEPQRELALEVPVDGAGQRR